MQRDLLPIVEGSTVQTKYGMVRTDHILFIAAGAFHVSKPCDLIPELQGRFPIRVELKSLTEARLRAHPQRAQERAASSSTRRWSRPRASDAAVHDRRRARDRAHRRGRERDAWRTSARAGCTRCSRTLLEDVLFEAPFQEQRVVEVDAAYVGSRLNAIVKDEDLRRYIL